MQRESWPLLALSFANEHRLSPVQMQKALFLVGQYVIETPVEYYHFEPYHYGPFDSTVYADLDELSGRGLVRRIESPLFRGFEYELTPLGDKQVKSIQCDLSNKQLSYLTEVIPWVRSQSFRQLVMAIYKAFPWTSQNSVFRD
jgi:uncharacterized protein YwgA